MVKEALTLCILSVFLSFFCVTQSIANNWSNRLSVGVGRAVVGETKTITISKTPAPGLTNTYETNGDANASFYISYTGGYNFDLRKEIELSLGAEVGYLNYGSNDGIVKPFVNDSDDYDVVGYNYNSQSYMLSTYAKLLWKRGNWQPFALGGIGIAYNHLGGYTEVGINGSSGGPSPYGFRDHIRSDLAYNVGLGLRRAINDTMAIELSYRYINTGKGELGTSSIQTTNQKLDSILLKTHLLVLSVSFS